MRRLSQLLAFAVAVSATSLVAQAPKGYDTLSQGAVAESLKVLDRVTAYSDKHPKDADAFHHIGMLAFVLEQRAISPNPPSGLNRWHLRNVAELSFLKALDLDPKNPVHWSALGRFTTMGGSARTVPRAYFEGAVKLARGKADSSELFKAALDLGAANWRHSESHDDKSSTPSVANSISGAAAFDAIAPPPPASASQLNNHKLDRDKPALDNTPVFGTAVPNASSTVWGAAGQGVALLGLPTLMNSAIERIHETWHNYPTPEAFYLRGEAFTREAYDMRPEDPYAFRQLSAILLGRSRWADMRALADEHVRRAPSDPWGWMTLGLAEQRLKSYVGAAIAFDSGLVRLSPEDRARYARFDRVLGPRDSARYAALDNAGRAEMARVWWLLADPLWSEDQEAPRVEFLARMTYSDLRYSRDVARINGADTPIGDIQVRYGPPDEWVGPFSVYRYGIAFSECMRTGKEFRGVCPQEELDLRDRVKEWQPSRWDNIANVFIDSMPTQVARFRASADSVDVYLAALAPIAELRKVQTGNTPMRANVWLNAWGTSEVRQRSVELDPSGIIAVHETVPVGRYYYRMESVVPGALVAGRTAASVTMGNDTTTGFTMRGFGLSDLLVAKSVASSAAPRRWTDLAFTPLMGSIAKGTGVSLVWENYDLAQRNGAAEYSVTISIERVRSSVGRITARVVSGIAGAVGMDASADKLTMKFDRRVPSAAAIVDNIALVFDTTPAGIYKLTLSVRDAASGRTTSRTTSLLIRE